MSAGKNLRRPGYGRWAMLALAVMAVVPGCAGFRACGRADGDAWWGPDKTQHLIASALIGAGATLAAASQMDDGEAAALGMTSALAAGLAKEGYDLNVKKTCWSWKDLVWDVIGASLGVTAAAINDR